MKSLYLLLAELMVFVHLLWILFLVLGAIPGARWAWVKWLHLSALSFSILLQLFGWICPFTHVEVWLRRTAGATSYEGTFISHYLGRIVYAPLPPNAIFAGTLVVVAASLWVYFAPKRKS